MFRTMCILSGCDYNSHLRVKGLGIQSAAKIVHVFRDLAIDRVLQLFPLPCSHKDYLKNFQVIMTKLEFLNRLNLRCWVLG